MRKMSLLACFLGFALAAVCQYPDNLHNAQLRTWLKANTYDGSFSDLGYNQARIQMYSYVDEVNGKIECVYTGFQMDAEAVTFPNPINAEHIVPQSFFNSASPMKSDIYNLRPTHQNANSARGNLSFDEVPDASATWYGTVGNTYNSTNNEPNPNDEYSEKGSDWEPREDRKGDVARQVFYFYTMYPTQAGSIAGLADVEQLYQWHLDDPVTDLEMQRNDRAEEAQGNRNPYVDWADLVYDAWLWEMTESVDENEAPELLVVFPIPAQQDEQLTVVLEHDAQIVLVDGFGKEVFRQFSFAGKTSLSLNRFSRGVYTLLVKNQSGMRSRKVLVI